MRDIRLHQDSAVSYDGPNAVQELNGTSPTANILTGGTDEVFSRTDSNGVSHFLSDPLGSTLALTDSTGTVQTQYIYEPFGNTTQSGNPSNNPSQFTGRESDATGLYYYRARYYSPVLQRFISEDPIGFRGGSANFYAYTGNSPTNFRDPSGKVFDPVDLAIESCLFGGAAGGWNYAWSPAAARKGWGGFVRSAGRGCFQGVATTMLMFGAMGAFLGAMGEASLFAAEEAEALEAGGAGCFCFPADTPVQTDKGQVSIQKIRVGDRVLSLNRTSGKLEYKAVTALIPPHPSKLVELRFDGVQEVLNPTPEHPLFARHGERTTGAWIPAAQIRVDDQILAADGNWRTIRSVVPVAGEQLVYNFEVEDDHDFFVGSGSLLVHNSGLCDIARPIIDKAEMFECDTCARQLGEAFEAAGYEPTVVEAIGGPFDVVTMEGVGEISTSGYHVGVEVDGLVFDNLNNGIPSAEWEASMSSASLKFIRTLFSLWEGPPF